MIHNLKLDNSAIRVLAARLELERSSLLCVQLAHALGYRVSGKPGSVQLEKPGSRARPVYFSIDVLIEDLVREAGKLVGRL
ncbi:MAG: hypothetical protein ACRDHZ_04085 [Ktedonobacteraceae bacterium]